MDITFPQYTPVFSVVLALMVPFVIQECAFFMIRAFPDIIGVRLLRVCCAIVFARPGRSEVVIRYCTQILKNGCKRTFDIIWRNCRLAIKLQFNGDLL